MIRTDASGIRTYSPRRKRTTASAITEKLISVAVVVAFWLGLWFLLAIRTGTDLLLPSPVSVFRRFVALAGTRELWQATGHTLLRILLGYAAGVLSGTILAALTAWSRHAAALLSPLGRMVKATPVASFIILALVWIPANNIPSFIVFLMVTPIVWDALRTALENTDPALLEMARAYRFGRVRTVVKLDENQETGEPLSLEGLNAAFAREAAAGVGGLFRRGKAAAYSTHSRKTGTSSGSNCVPLPSSMILFASSFVNAFL